MYSAQSEPIPNVLLVSSDAKVRSNLQETFGADYQMVAIDDSEATIAVILDKTQPDIIVIVRESVDEAYLESLSNMMADAPLPILVFVYSDPNRTARAAIRLGITSFVVDEFEASRMPTLIDVTLERFEQAQSLRAELLKSQEELAARKIIDRAKGLLMDRKNMTEEEAYRSLRDLAMRQAKPIREVAETLLTYSELLP